MPRALVSPLVCPCVRSFFVSSDRFWRVCFVLYEAVFACLQSVSEMCGMFYEALSFMSSGCIWLECCAAVFVSKPSSVLYMASTVMFYPREKKWSSFVDCEPFLCERRCLPPSKPLPHLSGCTESTRSFQRHCVHVVMKHLPCFLDSLLFAAHWSLR